MSRSNDQGMHKPYIYAGVGLLAISGVLASCGSPVALRTDAEVCHTSGIDGDLVPDAEAGTAIVDTRYGQRHPIAWPRGYTARNSLSGVEVVNSQGEVVARTGTHVSLLGGVSPDGSFEACIYGAVKP